MANLHSINDLVNGMFAAKSATDDLPATALVMTDYKLFTFGSKQIGIGVAETLTPGAILSRKDELLEVLREEKQRARLAMMFFVTVDVINLTAVVLGASEAEVRPMSTVFVTAVSNSFFLLSLSLQERVLLEGFKARQLEPHLFDIGPLVSRKKDILPLVSKYIKEHPL